MSRPGQPASAHGRRGRRGRRFLPLACALPVAVSLAFGTYGAPTPTGTTSTPSAETAHPPATPSTSSTTPAGTGTTAPGASTTSRATPTTAAPAATSLAAPAHPIPAPRPAPVPQRPRPSPTPRAIGLWWSGLTKTTHDANQRVAPALPTPRAAAGADFTLTGRWRATAAIGSREATGLVHCAHYRYQYRHALHDEIDLDVTTDLSAESLYGLREGQVYLKVVVHPLTGQEPAVDLTLGLVDHGDYIESDQSNGRDSADAPAPFRYHLGRDGRSIEVAAAVIGGPYWNYARLDAAGATAVRLALRCPK